MGAARAEQYRMRTTGGEYPLREYRLLEDTLARLLALVDERAAPRIIPVERACVVGGHVHSGGIIRVLQIEHKS